MHLAHCTALLIDLFQGEHLQILGERRGDMCKSSIFETKQPMSLKRSGLEPKLLQSVCRNFGTVYRLVTMTNLLTSNLRGQGHV